jgi:hypothetical protein
MGKYLVTPQVGKYDVGSNVNYTIHMPPPSKNHIKIFHDNLLLDLTIGVGILTERQDCVVNRERQRDRLAKITTVLISLAMFVAMKLTGR